MAPEIGRLIRRIEIRTTQLAKDILAGIYRSAFKGKGMEFEEVREYQQGDDIRSIDWSVTARMNHPYVKVFREERELTVWLLIDLSASSRYGSKNKLKLDLICEISALIAFSAIKNNDRVGMILFTDKVEHYYPPRNTSRHVLRLIRDLLIYQPKDSKTNIAAALSFLGKIQAKSSVCFVISDFLSPDFQHDAQLIAIKHDLIGVGITDPSEIDLPQLHLVHLQDLERPLGEIINTSNASLRTHFRSSADQRLAQTQHLLRKIGADFVDIRTDQPYVPVLKNFFRVRSKRRK
jgi:uncharacterized protein (DUF58 family)